MPFNYLKTVLSSSPLLALTNNTDDVILDTDASDVALKEELNQVQEGQENVVAYGSFALTPEQRRYCTIRKELLAIVRQF